ncbi:hypothetical protein EVAR_80096_1 [Eumeta japonica]|uniref:Uncharacterized protein n=1 Tax=Eumeta variegata TaxID=151549 RepID=A0A4C1UCM2_EUMVA|nr:hypothetical protein EVAR_80096_1 [Eumeta japonica]
MGGCSEAATSRVLRSPCLPIESPVRRRSPKCVTRVAPRSTLEIIFGICNIKVFLALSESNSRSQLPEIRRGTRPFFSCSPSLQRQSFGLNSRRAAAHERARPPGEQGPHPPTPAGLVEDDHVLTYTEALEGKLASLEAAVSELRALIMNFLQPIPTAH